MAAKIKKKTKKMSLRAPKKKTEVKEDIDVEEIKDLDRDVDRGEDVEVGVHKHKVEEIDSEDAEEDKADDDGFEYGERGVVEEEEEY